MPLAGVILPDDPVTIRPAIDKHGQSDEELLSSECWVYSYFVVIKQPRTGISTVTFRSCKV